MASGGFGEGDGDGNEQETGREGDGDGDEQETGHDGNGDDSDNRDDSVPVGEGCSLGEAGNFATDAELNLFGDIIYFAKGKELPAGRYRVEYADGCMKYASFFGIGDWFVNQSVGKGPDGWWLVGASSSERVTLLPGTTQGFSDFAACIAANKQLAPTEFDFSGGKLGIYLNDNPYLDNAAGEGGNNPKWKLSLLVESCPPDLVLF